MKLINELYFKNEFNICITNFMIYTEIAHVKR